MRIVFASVIFGVKMYKFFGKAKNNTRVSQLNGCYKKLPLSLVSNLSHFQQFKIKVAWYSNWLKSKNMSFCIRGMREMNTSSFTNLLICCNLYYVVRRIQNSHIRSIPTFYNLGAGGLKFQNNNM